MKKVFIILFLFTFLNGCTEISEDQQNTDRLYGVVSNVVDGDTIDVKMEDGSIERVRLLLIDTPETKHPQMGVQPFGLEASEYTESALMGERVELEFDISERDRYGRVLAYIWHQDELFNQALLKKGLARVSIYPPDIKYVDEFEKTQEEARESKLGIWSVQNYVTDEGYDRHLEKLKDDEVIQPVGCTIKGNINSKGEKIYHDADSRSYDQTIPEEWFCTKEEAEASGYRAPKN